MAKHNGFTRWRGFLASPGLEMASATLKEFTVTHTIRIGDMYISDEEFCRGAPSAETMQSAIERSVNYDMKSLEKFAKYAKL